MSDYLAKYKEQQRLRHNEQSRRYYAEHREKMRAYWKQWSAEHPGYFSKEARLARKEKGLKPSK